MKRSDFENTQRFTNAGEVPLYDWVINGLHYPKVTTFIEQDGKACYQVCKSADVFRRTSEVDANQIAHYGKWEKLWPE